MNLLQHNQQAWDNYVDKNDQWTIPVSEKEIAAARNGQVEIVLTPTKKVPLNWFPKLAGLKILGLASGGGQQGPILAAAGATVTIFDNSPKQLGQDQKLSEQYNLGIKTVRGDMRDLSVFENESFDLIFNPCSILFVDNIQLIWNECYRVLKPNGVLMTGLINPMAFQINEDSLQLTYPQPFSDLKSLPEEELKTLLQNKEALVFGHSLSDQIGGQLNAGFAITNMFEDNWNGDNKLDAYFPSFMATRAVKQ